MRDAHRKRHRVGRPAEKVGPDALPLGRNLIRQRTECMSLLHVADHLLDTRNRRRASLNAGSLTRLAHDLSEKTHLGRAVKNGNAAPRPFKERGGKPHGKHLKATDVRRQKNNRTTTVNGLAHHCLGFRRDMNTLEHSLGRTVPNPKALHGLSARIATDSFMQMRIVITSQLQILHSPGPGGWGQLEGQASDARPHDLQKTQREP